jgi:hypothetical protein
VVVPKLWRRHAIRDWQDRPMRHDHGASAELARLEDACACAMSPLAPIATSKISPTRRHASGGDDRADSPTLRKAMARMKVLVTFARGVGRVRADDEQIHEPALIWVRDPPW